MSDGDGDGGDPFRRSVDGPVLVRTSRLARASAHAADVALGLGVFVFVAIVADAAILAAILAVATTIVLALPDFARRRIRRADLALDPNLEKHRDAAHRMAIMLPGVLLVVGHVALAFALVQWFFASGRGEAALLWLFSGLRN